MRAKTWWLLLPALLLGLGIMFMLRQRHAEVVPTRRHIPVQAAIQDEVDAPEPTQLEKHPPEVPPATLEPPVAKHAEAETVVTGVVLDAWSGRPILSFDVGAFWVAEPVPFDAAEIDGAATQEVKAWHMSAWGSVEDNEGRFSLKFPPRPPVAGSMFAPGMDWQGQPEASQVETIQRLYVAARTPEHAPDYAYVASLQLSDTSAQPAYGPVTISLTPGATVKGKVTDVEGAPVSAATVYTEIYGAEPGTRGCLTDGAGQYVLKGLPERVRLEVRHSEFNAYGQQLGLIPGRVTSVDVVLEAAGAVEGIVTRAGLPVPDVRVSVHGSEATTDARGHYMITGLSSGTIVSLACKVGDREYENYAVIEAGGVTRVDFELGSIECGVRGSVLIEGEVPRSGHVRVSCPTQPGCAFRRDALRSGVYEMLELSPGEIVVVVDATSEQGTFVRAGAVLVIPENTVIQHDFLLERPGAITGHVSGVAEQEEVGVLLLPGQWNMSEQGFILDDLFKLAEASVKEDLFDSEGTFVLEDLAPGTYTLVAAAFTVEDGFPKPDDLLDSLRLSWVVFDVYSGQETEVEAAFE